MKTADIIQIPDTSKGQSAMACVNEIWSAIYYRNGKIRRRTLRTKDYQTAVKFRDQFYSDLVADNGATVRKGRSVADKLRSNPSLYIYKRPMYFCQITGHGTVAEGDDYKDVEKKRDKWLRENGML